MLSMTELRDLMTNEEGAMACAKRETLSVLSDYCLEQISAPALNTCAEILQEG